jgi:hypothetical protein
MTTLDFSNCKTKEDVDRVFKNSNLKEVITSIKEGINQEAK